MRTHYGPVQRRLIDRALSSRNHMLYVSERRDFRAALRLEKRGIFKRVGPFSRLFKWVTE
jgi:hypothetical protein